MQVVLARSPPELVPAVVIAQWKCNAPTRCEGGFMARPVMRSLDRFPTKTKLLYDTRVKALRRYFKDTGNANNAFVVFDFLFREIFGNEGYYIKYSDDLVGDTADFCYVTESFVIDVIQKCIELELFDKTQFEQNEILTSRAIQNKYQDIFAAMKRKAEMESRFCVHGEVVYSEETPVYSEETPVYSEETPPKERKKEKKERNGDCVSQNLVTEVAEEFNKYATMEHRSQDSPLSDYQRELKIAELLQITDRPEEQILVLRNTISNGWKKLVPPDDVNKSILERHIAEEVEERQAEKQERDAKLIADWRKKMGIPED